MDFMVMPCPVPAFSVAPLPTYVFSEAAAVAVGIAPCPLPKIPPAAASDIAVAPLPDSGAVVP